MSNIPKRNNWEQWDADETRRENHDRLVERFLPPEHQQWVYLDSPHEFTKPSKKDLK